MSPTYFQELYDFNDWNNRRVWACLLPLPDEQMTQAVDESGWSLLIHCFHVTPLWWPNCRAGFSRLSL